MEIKMIVEKNKKYQDPKSVFIDKYEVKFEIRGLPIVVNMALYKERSGSYLFVVNYTQIINIIILGMEFLISKGQIVGEEQAAASRQMIEIFIHSYNLKSHLRKRHYTSKIFLRVLSHSDMKKSIEKLLTRPFTNKIKHEKLEDILIKWARDETNSIQNIIGSVESWKKTIFNAFYKVPDEVLLELDKPNHTTAMEEFTEKLSKWLNKDIGNREKRLEYLIAHKFKDLYPKQSPNSKDALKNYFKLLYHAWDCMSQFFHFGAHELYKKLDTKFKFDDITRKRYESLMYPKSEFAKIPFLMIASLVHEDKRKKHISTKSKKVHHVIDLLAKSSECLLGGEKNTDYPIKLFALHIYLNNLEHEGDKIRKENKKLTSYNDNVSYKKKNSTASLTPEAQGNNEDFDSALTENPTFEFSDENKHDNSYVSSLQQDLSAKDFRIYEIIAGGTHNERIKWKKIANDIHKVKITLNSKQKCRDYWRKKLLPKIKSLKR